ncbi:Transcriptional adapter ADA2 [Zea mays]|uniref:Transcriptional adapter ADA2 n=1 Tax=Zea mays TaxID=4577 RepID=A0A3L6EPG7_MAIZE|nr:Transcriptional adapter ADA2 [Zea mays]
MGRSRGVLSSGDDDTGHRSKRRRVSSGGDATDSISASIGGAGEGGGKKALYHCNYCNKDISGKIRIKCSKCPDFDLCVECFSVGAEVTPHRSNHPYKVMDNLSFPLICPDWNADEEILLLEDMSHVNGKNRKELLAMAKVQGESKKGTLLLPGELTPKVESQFSPSRVKVEDALGEGPAGRSPSQMAVGANKKASNLGQIKDGANVSKVEDVHVDRSVGVKKPRYSADEGPSLTELSGYNAKRHEFDPEYDNDAEQALAEMEFKETDSETDRELKLRVLRIYLSRLDERKRRKEFILERNLLFPNPLEKDLTSEDRELYHRYKVFMRFLSKEEHEALVRSVIEERKIRRRIQELQECRSAGCRTLAEAKIHIEQKRKKEYELNAQKAKDSSQLNANNKSVQKMNRPMKIESDGNLDPKKGGAGLDSPKTTGPTSVKQWDDWDIVGLPGAELLSASEKLLCCQNRLLPSHYLRMQEVLMQEIFKGSVLKKEDAHVLFKVDPTKVDSVYDMLVFSGDPSGRLLKFNPQTKETTVLHRNLRFPNGVSMSKDGLFFVFCEGSRGRLSRYWLKGEKAGTVDLFASLPGFPDNVRTNEKGEFWVAIHCRRSLYARLMSRHVKLRKFLLSLPIPAKYHYLMQIGGKLHAVIIKYSPEGQVLDILEDNKGEVVRAVSEVEEKDGKLWIRSVLMPFIAVFDLTKAS